MLLGYEQVGTVDLETVYTELELGDREPGRYALEVVITDLNSEQTASKNALFRRTVEAGFKPASTMISHLVT